MICISVQPAEKIIFLRRVFYNFRVLLLLSLRNIKKKNVKGKRDGHVRNKTCTLSSKKIDYTDTAGTVIQTFALLLMRKNNYSKIVKEYVSLQASSIFIFTYQRVK